MRGTAIFALAVGLLVGLGAAGGAALLWLRAEHARIEAEAVRSQAGEAEIRTRLDDMKAVESALEKKAAEDREVLRSIQEMLYPVDDPPGGDKDLGWEWVIVSVVLDGEDRPQGLVRRTTFRRDVMVVEIGDVAQTYTITVDACKTPKEIDITPDFGNGKTRKGIYEVKADDLRVCTGAADKDRPTDFSAKEGSGRTLTNYKRIRR